MNIKKSSSLFICLMASLAGLLIGVDIGVIAGALPFIAKDFNLSPVEQEWVAGIMLGGAAIGSIATKWLSSQLGRKKSLLLSSALFVITAILSGLAPNIEFLYIMRFFLGITVGIASFTAPLYLAEIAPARSRGAMITLFQLMITTGILLIYFVDLYFTDTENWRAMVSIVAIPAVVMFCGVFLLPKSPRWLVLQDRVQEAHQVLLSLRASEQSAQQELIHIRESIAIKQRGWALFKENRNVRRSVGLGILLQFMAQFTGMNIIFYYAPKIFALAGYASAKDQIIGTVLVGFVNMLATFIAVSFTDKLGRKPLLALGFLMVAAGILALAVMLGQTTPLSPNEQYFSIGMMFVSIIGFAMGAGPISWMICAEIQPLAARDFGLTCSTAAIWIANMIVVASFLSLLTNFGVRNALSLYTILNIICIVLTYLFCPETKGVSLEHLEKNLMHGKPLRKLGSH